MIVQKYLMQVSGDHTHSKTVKHWNLFLENVHIIMYSVGVEKASR